MDPTAAVAIGTAITSFAGSILAYRKFSAESALAQKALELERQKGQAEISAATTTAATDLLDDMAQDREYYRQQVKDLRAELCQVRQGLESNIADLKAKIAERDLHLAQAWERITALETESELQQNQIELLKTENQNLRQQIAAGG